MKPIFLVDGVRTPIIKMRGKANPFSASDLAVVAGQQLFLRSGLPKEAVDEVIFGCVMPAPEEANIARLIGLRLGLPVDTTAYTVQRNCASGMQAIDSACMSIASGRSEVVLAGGVETMSHAPVLWSPPMVQWLSEVMHSKRMLQRLKNILRLPWSKLAPVIGLLRGLQDSFVNLSMGQTAEKIAQRFKIGREQMDTYAARSHARLSAAIDEERLSDEICLLLSPNGERWSHDDGLRRGTDIAQLGKLKAVFDKPYGSITAGNSAQISDGASCLLIASEKAVAQYSLKVKARLVACEWAALDPSQMGLGPVHAVHRLLDHCRLKVENIDCWEINEAFAAQVLACLEAFKDQDYCVSQLKRKSVLGEIDQEKLNIDGGAVACGHPVGMTGARIVLHVANLLERLGKQKGVAALCIGGGQGGAMLIARE